MWVARLSQIPPPPGFLVRQRARDDRRTSWISCELVRCSTYLLRRSISSAQCFVDLHPNVVHFRGLCPTCDNKKKKGVSIYEVIHNVAADVSLFLRIPPHHRVGVPGQSGWADRRCAGPNDDEQAGIWVLRQCRPLSSWAGPRPTNIRSIWRFSFLFCPLAQPSHERQRTPANANARYGARKGGKRAGGGRWPRLSFLSF